MINLPTPKFAVGDVVYLPRLERAVEKLPCPDCLGTGVWPITSPAGVEFKIACIRCVGTLSMSDLPSLHVERWEPRTEALTINGVSTRSNPDNWHEAVEYSHGNGQSVGESKIFETQEAALAIAEATAKGRNVEIDAKPETMQARHLSRLTIKDADADQSWNSRWRAWYAYRELREALESAVEEVSEYNAKQRLDDLADNLKFLVRDIPEIGAALSGLRNLMPVSPEAEAHFAVLAAPPVKPAAPVEEIAF